MRSEVDPCPWLCHAPDGPGTPFAWPMFAVFDAFRVYIAVAALILVVISVWAVRGSATAGQRARFLFAALICAGAAGTEIEHLGDWPHYRFVFYLAGVSIGLWGYWRHLAHELPARDRPTEKDRAP